MRIQNRSTEPSSRAHAEGAHDRSPKSKIENGFTLLEVVVAMAIVGLGVVTLLEIFSLGLRLEQRSAMRTEAVDYSRQMMDQLLARPALREGGEGGPAGEKSRWELRVEPRREENLVSASSWELKEIALQVQYGNGEDGKTVELKTLRLVKKKGT